MPHSLLPLLILKNPLSPHPSFQLLATNQQGVLFSTPHPTILMACPPKAEPLTWWYTPDLQARKSLQTVKAASTGPWVKISVWILATWEGTEQTESATHRSVEQDPEYPLAQVVLHLGVGWEEPQGPYFPLSTWWSQGAKVYGMHQLEVLWSHPVTRPVLCQWLNAPEGQPPLHPEPQLAPQHVNKSSAEILVWSFWPLAMQIRSLMASTAPKAQHEPQVLWSRTSLMDSQLGQAEAEENSSGMSWRGSMFLRGSFRCSGVSRVPMRCLICSRSMPSKQLLWPAFQLFWLLLTWSMMDWKSRKRRSFLATAERASRHSTKTVSVFIKEINYQSYNLLTIYALTHVQPPYYHSPYYLFMKGAKLPSSGKQNDKKTIPYHTPHHLPDPIEQILANPPSSRAYPLKLPPTLPKKHSQAESIKAAIHKLHTETTQFSELGFMPARSRSYFIERTPVARQSQERVLEMFTNMRNSQKRETKYFLPGVGSGEVRRGESRSVPRAQPQQGCNVILLKRNMRYRLQKLPIFDKPPPPSDPQLNISLTGWHRNPEETDEFPHRF